MSKVAILGAGNLALTFAGDIARRLNEEVTAVIWAPTTNRRNFNEVRGIGTLELVGPDYEGAFTPQLEDDLEAAILDAEFIFLTVPTLAQEGILRELVKFDLSETVLIALPGSATSLTCKNILFPSHSPVAVIESTTSPYACRRIGERVHMLGVKACFEVAATSLLSNDLTSRFEALFPNRLQWYKDAASIFFSNTNPVVHPPGILVAKDAIENGMSPLPKFYREFVPAAIERVQELDNERLEIIAALGLESETGFTYSKKWYGGQATEWKEFFETYEGYAEVGTPTTMHHRYLTEDVKHIMVLWVQIAEVAGVQVPAMKSVIKEAGNVLYEDLFMTGRTLASMNLGGANPYRIVDALNGN
ncbi:MULTISPECIES: vitopine synthase [Rhizobium/Agrobacterium group]|uniref:Vitopine synthase n=3 Tax=Rhizobium/Agrobacterium group TaxID=227290 RepID=VIS_ALLAM|nr:MULTISPECIES: NAD/NADP-dependent octopine/nopaline dehydrogenase family protein [Rhizobium/Agrobacterium group]Q04554.1 RecName: Full=Vitopine synthase [Allorhizobium ampelinum S4]AAA25044.1 vitopine synthase [Plasmid pTiS4]ACM39698.1 D-vitopine dehydrogenase [Allorhizobium ampelinum S4]ASK49726.1 vitopine synthase [Agrobacterium vitis]MCF1437087.1 vitopine synthase [Allorhizobium ampelinum]MCF1450749.1 vitopine synthase [Allorhizobium ampelinum]